MTCTNDVLGNRLTKGATSYTWDAMNRMTALNNGMSTTNYLYRADGMRVSKSSTTGRTLYCYDGQMGMEDIEYDGSLVWQKTSDFALGARGIDAISVTTGTGTTISYPIYDAHGNMISTLSKAGAGYTFTAERSYDAWGVLRLGAQTGDPKVRYCANLGHKQDDESGLVYMRARYYEPGSGRFVSEDSRRSGSNWFAYCSNNPVSRFDPNGKDWQDDAYFVLGALLRDTGIILSGQGFREVLAGAAALRAAGAVSESFGGFMAFSAEKKMQVGVEKMLAGAVMIWVGNLFEALGADASEFVRGCADFIGQFNRIFGIG